MVKDTNDILFEDAKRKTSNHRPFECPFCVNDLIINEGNKLNVIYQKGVKIKECNGNEIVADIIYCARCEKILSIIPH